MLDLRAATMDDCDMIYKWRNDSRVRKFFFDPRELSHAEHRDWLTKSLQRDDRFLLIASDRSGAVGIIRFDEKSEQPGTAEIDVFVDPERHGQGLGTEILRAGEHWIQKNTRIRHFTAKVLADNLASIRIFTRCGFEKGYICFEKDL
jgi:RimJ/RimL family protein N-acetyltransferase